MKVQSHAAQVPRNRPKSWQWMSARRLQSELVIDRHRGSIENLHPAARGEKQRNFAGKQNCLRKCQVLALSGCNDCTQQLLALASCRVIQTGRVKTNGIRFPALAWPSGS